MERNFKWQDVLFVAVRAALLAALTLVGDHLAGHQPSAVIARVLGLPGPAARHLAEGLEGSLSKSFRPVLFVPENLSASVKRSARHLG